MLAPSDVGCVLLLQVNFDIRLMDELMTSVAECDTIFAASSSEDILIESSHLEEMPPASAAVGGMRRFFDISVPRNIGPCINQMEGATHVYNVDDLKEVPSVHVLASILPRMLVHVLQGLHCGTRGSRAEWC